jgi:hypothetical protein
VLWVLLALMLAGAAAGLIRRFATAAGRQRAAARRARWEQRPYAPDDDEDFLRELDDRRRLHGDD